MGLICAITDKDLNEKSVEISNPKLRYGARGIVIRNDGKIAVFNKSKKNEYKLPGGGIEENENPKEAFKREVLEETGCIIEIIDELGTTEEYKSQDNFKQTSFVFVGKVIEDTKILHLTQKEKDEGAILTWEYPYTALELIKNSYNNLIASDYESVYHTKFVVFRDRKILEFINNWLNDLKKYWLDKDVDSAVSLFTETKYYQETPFVNPYTTLDEIADEWKHIKNEDIKKIEFRVLAVDGYNVIVEWYLEQNDDVYDGIYEIHFNNQMKCIYFKSWEMKI